MRSAINLPWVHIHGVHLLPWGDTHSEGIMPPTPACQQKKNEFCRFNELFITRCRLLRFCRRHSSFLPKEKGHRQDRLLLWKAILSVVSHVIYLDKPTECVYTYDLELGLRSLFHLNHSVVTLNIFN